MSLTIDREILITADNTDFIPFEPTSRVTAAGTELPMIDHERMSFSLEEYLRRYNAIQASMARQDLDAILLRAPENITYFCGYETPGYYKYHCIVVPRSGEPVFIIRDFECLNIAEYSWITRFAKVYDFDNPPDVTVNILQQLGLADGKRIGVEKQGWFLTVDEWETLNRAMPGNTWIDSTEVLWSARMIKSAAEIEVMRESARLVDLATQAGWDAAIAGATGNHINAIVNKVLFENGGQYMGLPPFVLAGDFSCLPHQTGGPNALQNDDLMYFEISASHKRYTAALMSTVFLGRPKDEWIRVAEACIGAVDKALELIRPGAIPHEIDLAARQVMVDAGFGDLFRNRLGYSIGISFPPDWGEGEIISLRQQEYRPLQPGMTFHLPPMALKYREYGIGYSASVIVTESGCERLSKLPQEVVIKR